MSPAELATLEAVTAKVAAGQRDLDTMIELRVALHNISRDLDTLRRSWRSYKRRFPAPAFTPTVEQLPYYDVPGEVQIALL